MNEETKDSEKENASRRRYLQTIADLKQYEETQRLKDELAKKYEESK